MSLIKCSECVQDVSDKAGTCPHCGNPISKAVSEPVQTITRIETIEHTRKKWKALILVGVVMMFVGVPMFVINFMNGLFASFNGTEPNAVALLIGFVLSVLGFLAFLIGAVGSWWQHG